MIPPSPRFEERVSRIVRQWPQWSPAERRRMDAVVDEVLDHVINGTGNRFIASWCERVLSPQLEGQQHGK